jgi:hypothetical protein
MIFRVGPSYEYSGTQVQPQWQDLMPGVTGYVGEFALQAGSQYSAPCASLHSAAGAAMPTAVTHVGGKR